MTKQERIDAFESQWRSKTKRQAEKELESYRKYLEKNRDSFFQQCAPDEMSDGDRVLVLKQILAEIK